MQSLHNEFEKNDPIWNLVGSFHFTFALYNIASSNLIVPPSFDDFSAYTINFHIWPVDLSRENFLLNLWPKNYNMWHTTEAMSMSGTLIAIKNRSSVLNEQNWMEILYRTEWKNIRWSNQKCSRSSSFKSAVKAISLTSLEIPAWRKSQKVYYRHF